MRLPSGSEARAGGGGSSYRDQILKPDSHAKDPPQRRQHSADGYEAAVHKNSNTMTGGTHSTRLLNQTGTNTTGA